MPEETKPVCGFPNTIEAKDTPCQETVVESIEITVEGQGVLVVPTCEFHYYAFLRIPDWRIGELLSSNKLRGEWKK